LAKIISERKRIQNQVARKLKYEKTKKKNPVIFRNADNAAKTLLICFGKSGKLRAQDLIDNKVNIDNFINYTDWINALIKRGFLVDQTIKKNDPTFGPGLRIVDQVREFKACQSEDFYSKIKKEKQKEVEKRQELEYKVNELLDELKLGDKMTAAKFDELKNKLEKELKQQIKTEVREAVTTMIAELHPPVTDEKIKRHLKLVGSE